VNISSKSSEIRPGACGPVFDADIFLQGINAAETKNKKKGTTACSGMSFRHKPMPRLSAARFPSVGVHPCAPFKPKKVVLFLSWVSKAWDFIFIFPSACGGARIVISFPPRENSG
jgi:hypothetical protein